MASEFKVENLPEPQPITPVSIPWVTDSMLQPWVNYPKPAEYVPAVLDEYQYDWNSIYCGAVDTEYFLSAQGCTTNVTPVDTLNPVIEPITGYPIIRNSGWYSISISWYWAFGWSSDKRCLKIYIDNTLVAWDNRPPRTSWAFHTLTYTCKINAGQKVRIAGEVNDTAKTYYGISKLNILMLKKL